jgi:sodium/potassium-transporting ATPase subunit beta
MVSKNFATESENVFKRKVHGFFEFIWNTKTREFCGRDGASWAKVSLFYGIFYLLLGGFFIGMLAVFFAVTPKDKPTYYGVSSVMSQKGLNPGMGFRPQIDPEDLIIKYNPLVHVESDFGLEKYFSNLKIFLNDKYDSVPNENTVDCSGSESAGEDKSCKFDYKTIYDNTSCTAENKFGYESQAPCVLIKLNKVLLLTLYSAYPNQIQTFALKFKIISWQPKTQQDFIAIRCNGENPFDVDNIRKITYLSENHPENNQEARIPNKYFPYL